MFFMQLQDLKTTNRRGFLGILGAVTAAFGMASVATPLHAAVKENIPAYDDDDPDAWFSQIKGKHRIVFDATAPHEIFPFAWPRVFLLTNAATGTPEKNCNAVVVLRHEAIPFAMEDRLWAKYHFGEVFKVNDPLTSSPSVRNMFWKPSPGTYKIPGIGPVQIGINELQQSGVMLCVCNMAITVFSAAIAAKSNTDAAEVKKDFLAGVLPGIQVVPSGVWAVGRAQEHGCSYCFVG
jgi:intracellular sulfur oxidation DsrE/DsrF family protein